MPDMDTLRRDRLRHATLALLAAWVLALAPTVSRALAWSTQSLGAWAEVCTAAGPQRLAAAAASGDVHGAAAHLEHCGHCALSALFCVAPSPSSLVLHAAAGTAKSPSPAVPATAPSHWPAAPARAPPRRA